MMAMLLLWEMKNWIMTRGSLCRLKSLGKVLFTCLSHEYEFLNFFYGYLRVLVKKLCWCTKHKFSQSASIGNVRSTRRNKSIMAPNLTISHGILISLGPDYFPWSTFAP